MRLHYVFSSGSDPIEATLSVREDEVYTRWLHATVDLNPDTIFFYTVDSTDIWEES